MIESRDCPCAGYAAIKFDAIRHDLVSLGFGYLLLLTLTAAG